MTVKPPPGFEVIDSDGPKPPPGFEVVADKPERLDQSYLAGLARSALGQGTAFGFGDEIAAGSRAVFGDESYDDALKDERAKIAQFREENPKTALVGELVGTMATPGLGMLAGAIKPAATVGGRIIQGAKLGGGLGGLYGFASSEGGIGERLEGTAKGAAAGAVLGGAVPAVGAAAGNIMTRARNTAAPAIARYRGGVDKAADEIMASRLRAGGETPQAIRDRFSEADRVGTFYGGGRSASVTDSPLAIVDASPSMQKLAGSAARSSDDGFTRADAFLNSRQTGLPPQSEGGKAALAGTDIVTKNPLAPVPAIKPEPAGQYERVKDALTRAMTLEDKDFHKFGKNAYRTEQSMMEALKREADKLYSEARTAAQNINVQPVIEPIVKKVAAAIDNAPVGEAAVLRKTLRQFTTGNGNLVTSLEAFDKAKRAVDGMIGKARTSGDKNAERLMIEVKNELIAAVDGIQAQGVGDKYKAARSYFSSQMELKDAIDLGRKAFTEGTDIAVDQIKAMTHGEKKLFRLGLIESFENNLGRRKRTNDVTQIFETPRIQELLREVVPRTETATGRVKKGAVFADRPERLGDFISNEKAMVKTGNKVLGNSATAERLADDAKFTRQGLSQMFSNLRTSGGLTGVVFEGVASGLNKVFGMREDVASALARRLFTANPAEREAVLQRIEQTYGAQRLPQFLELMSKLSLVGTSGVAGQTGQAIAEPPRISGGIGPRYDEFGNIRRGQ